VPIHVQERGGQILDGLEALIEMLGLFELIDQFLWNRLAGFIMKRVGFQYGRIPRPVFHNLRRKLDKISGHSPRPAVNRIPEQAVQSVAQFMEQCLDLIHAHQGRFVGRRFGKIADVVDQRCDEIAVDIGLASERAGPRPASLAVSREVVGVENTQMSPVGLQNLEHLDVGMINLDIIPLDELYAVQFLGYVEGALANVLHLEIRPKHRVIQGVFFFLHFLGVVPPVPGFEFEVIAFGVDDRLHIRDFGLRSFQGRFPQLVEELVDALGILRHVSFENEIRVRLVAQQVRLYDP